MDLSSHSLTPWKHLQGIRGLVGFGTAYAALAHPVPYPLAAYPEAAPQCISGRTSYHQP